jgi:hypothetical protein
LLYCKAENFKRADWELGSFGLSFTSSFWLRPASA